MFTDTFKLKKHSWHMSLMTEIWGYKPRDFSHMCPYFWLSVFNMTIGLLIVLPIKYLLFIPILYILNKLGDWSDKLQKKEWRVMLEKLRNDTNFYEAMISKNLNKKCNRKYDNFFDGLYLLDGELYLKLHRERTKYQEKEYEKIYRTATSKEPKTNKQKINISLKWVKPVGIVILWILAAATVAIALFGLYKAYIALVSIKALSWAKFFRGSLIVLKWVLIGVLAIGVGWMGISKIHIGCKTRKALRAPFITLGNGFLFILEKIWDFIEFIVQMLKSNCPSIEWRD